MNKAAISMSFAIVASLKQIANHLWNTEALADKNNLRTLIAALQLEVGDPKTFAGLSEKHKQPAILTSRLALLDVLLEEESQTPPRFIDIGFLLWIKAQTDAQKHLATLFIKLDSEAEELWLCPERLSEIKIEKITLLNRKILEIGNAAFPVFATQSRPLALAVNT